MEGPLWWARAAQAATEYYKCVSMRKHKGCKKKTVRKHWIEDIVIKETVAMLHDDSIFRYIIDTVMDLQGKANADLPLLRQQLAETEKGIENMVNAIQQGIITSSTKKRLDELENNKSKLEVAILQEEMEKPLLTREQVTFFIQKYRTIDITKEEKRQRMIDTFINAVYLYDDKIVFTFNYKDETKMVTTADIQGSDLGAAPAQAFSLFSLTARSPKNILKPGPIPARPGHGALF